jgi:BON domain
VNVRSLFLSAVVAGSGLAAAGAAEPAKLPQPVTKSAASSNQTLADAVANQLTSTGSAANADVSISCIDGVVTVTGTAKDSTIHGQIIDDIRRVAGVKKVRDGLTMPATNLLVKAQAIGPVASQPIAAVPPSATGSPVVEPTPLGMPGGAAMMPGGGEMSGPPLPPYAWPTYAPHNNLSRVAYPQAYPYNAFPFIGPFYPFPKVPPGWRKVVLEWEDGHWWLGRLQTGQDYWRTSFR